MLRPNFVVLCLGVHPERVCQRQVETCRQLRFNAACRTWRYVLIRQMAPLNLRTLSVCHTRDPCVRCALSLRIAELLVFRSQTRRVIVSNVTLRTYSYIWQIRLYSDSQRGQLLLLSTSPCFWSFAGQSFLNLLTYLFPIVDH